MYLWGQEMKLKRVIAVCVMVASLGLAAAQAKTLRDAENPAEYPPASFKGKQYVDSRGCVYIRAGIDGLVSWVPRVSRSRKVLCGQQPTFGAGQQIAAVAPKKSKVVQIVPEKMPNASVAVKPAAVAKPVVKAAPRKPVVRQKPVTIAPKPVARKVAAPKAVTPAPQIRRVQPAPKRVVSAPASKPVRRVAAAPAQRQQVTRQTTCTNFTGVSAQYAGRGQGVRCGPQKQSVTGMAVTRQPAKVMRNGQAVTVQRRVVRQAPAPQKRVVVRQQARPATIVKRNGETGAINAPGSTRVVPRHVYNQQQAAKVRNETPKGYRKAWNDDRLNTKRAHMSVEGIRQSDLLWTRTVPRKLYLRSSGRVVNKLFPDLRYPYTSMADQNKAMGFTTSTKNPSVAKQARPAAKVQASTGGRFVQVGTFGQSANANRAASRLQAAGLPVRMGTLKRSGKSYRVVLAGPFNSGQLNNALSKARRAGFSDAFVR